MGSAKPVKAVDTNILARIIVRDDAVQTPIAAAIVDDGVYVPITVFLELGWVLTSFYKFDRRRLNASLIGLLDDEAIHVDDEPAVRAALALHAEGADLADVLHLVAARGSEAFVTFDRDVPDGAGIGVATEIVG